MMKGRLALALIALLLGGPAYTEQASPDPELKARLVAALAESDGFRDRFDAEVWLTDMSFRLKRRMPTDEKRLELLKQIHLEARRAELEPEVVLAVIQVESNFDRFAISSAGAQGLMQIMPFWKDELGLPEANLFDVNTNLRFGCTILRFYLDKEKGNLTRALARYNGSLGKTWYPERVYTALRKQWHP